MGLADCPTVASQLRAPESSGGNHSMNSSRRSIIKAAAGSALLSAVPGRSLFAQGNAPIKVGVLHSLSGTMAISETSLKDVALMTFEEINAKGGVMGRKIEPVVVDPASNWPLFAEKARGLLRQARIAIARIAARPGPYRRR